MGAFVRKIGLFIVSAKGWLVFVTAIPTGWAFISGLMDGLPTSIIILIVMTVMAASAMFAHYSLVGFTYAANFWGKRRELNLVADRLQEMLDVGHKILSIDQITQIWCDDDVHKVYIYNPRLRRLKNATDEGRIRKHHQKTLKDSLPADKNTPILTEDVISLLRNGKL